MAEMENTWRRTEYETWEEAFHGLAPAVRQQSVRVAAYTQAIYVQACDKNFGKESKEASERMKGKYADLAYKCGMYHQIGKALVPHEYQIWNDSFTEEEQAVYKKYTSDGRVLASCLQEQSGRSRDRKKSEFSEQPTKNIPWLMIRESCEQHMERWDGKGYPDNLAGTEIPLVARIMSIVDVYDALTSERPYKKPYSHEKSMALIVADSGTKFDPALVEEFVNISEKIRDCLKNKVKNGNQFFLARYKSNGEE